MRSKDLVLEGAEFESLDKPTTAQDWHSFLASPVLALIGDSSSGDLVWLGV